MNPSPQELANSRVLVTGGRGFFGKHLIGILKDYYGVHADVCGSTKWCDVAEQNYERCELLDPQETAKCLKSYDYVFHLAGWNGGIKFNVDFVANIFYQNSMMALNVLEACHKNKVKKLVSTVASCAYPDVYHMDEPWSPSSLAEGILEEEEFLGGISAPNATVAGHGYAKRNLQLASYFYNKQFGLNAVCACPTTLYGPGDSFDANRTKVLGALVTKFVDAVSKGEQEVTIWGTGEPMREFLYVEDAARLLVETMLHYDDSSKPLNLGTGQELSIKDLAEKVAVLAGFRGIILYDRSKPDGQYRKRLDLKHMNKTLPSFKFTSLDVGIQKTIEYYKSCK